MGSTKRNPKTIRQLSVLVKLQAHFSRVTEQTCKESHTCIHSNKGKHDFYLHFSGYESGELRQEEKQYEETAADRDWKRGKEGKRLVSFL